MASSRMSPPTRLPFTASLFSSRIWARVLTSRAGEATSLKVCTTRLPLPKVLRPELPPAAWLIMPVACRVMLPVPASTAGPTAATEWISMLPSDGVGDEAPGR